MKQDPIKNFPAFGRTQVAGGYRLPRGSDRLLFKVGEASRHEAPKINGTVFEKASKFLMISHKVRNIL